MPSTPRVILLEFNELTPSLMDRFIAEGHLPNFQRLYRESGVFVTDAEESQWDLEPWIQWVTVHTGLSLAQHGLHNLDESYKLKSPNVWDLLSAAGHRVWVCGSMNVKYNRPIDGWVLPDAWSSRVDPYPDDLRRYFDFVRTSVGEHTNDKVPLSKAQYFGFLKFMCTHGLSLGTLAAIASQLLKERISGGRWKRASLLDRLQWDLFSWYQQKYRPAFSTFFVNSTAHFQHVYWREFEPEKFQFKETETNDHRDQAILYGYQQMDSLVKKALKLAGRETIVILSSALGQQPYLAAEETGGKHAHRPGDLSKFPDQIGLRGTTEVTPVMAEQFHIYFDSAESARTGAELLKSCTVAGKPGFHVLYEAGAKMLLTGSAVFQPVSENTRLLFPNGGSFRFHDVFYLVRETVKSGMHHPHGILWVRGIGREHSVALGTIPLRSVCPMILDMFGIAPTAEMLQPSISAGELVTQGSQSFHAGA